MKHSNEHTKPQLYNQTVLRNGLRIITATMPHTRSAAVHFYIRVGARHEAARLSGVSHFVEHMVFKGTAGRPDPVMLSEAIEGVGGSLNAATDQENTGYSALVPSAYLPVALDILTDMLLHSTFSPDEVERERHVIIEELSSTQDSPTDLNDLLFDTMLWGAHPLGKDIAGTPRTVRAISGDDLKAHTARYYTPNNIVISIAGNVRHRDVVKQVSALWGRVPQGSPPPPGKPPIWIKADSQVKIHRKRTSQANMILGVPALPYTDERRAVQDVLDTLLGGGMSSRLFVELRENRGLAYSVSTFTRTYADVGAFGVHAAVDDGRVVPALAVMLTELDRISSDLVSETELRKVKEYIKGHTLLSLERSSYVAHWAGWQELMLGRIETVDEVLGRIERVTPDDVRALAAELFGREKMRLALVGPFSDTAPFVDALNSSGTPVLQLASA